METTTSIDIDFNKLEENISSLQKLLPKLEEPTFDKVEFWLGGVTGSGMTLEHLVEFCRDAIKFHNNLYALIENTIAYLESIKKIKAADQSVAESL